MAERGYTLIECDGCGIELKKGLEDIFPMKSETYCRACHKKYGSWMEKVGPIYEQLDREKKVKVKELRRAHFGPKLADNNDIKPNTIITERIAESKDAMRDKS